MALAGAANWAGNFVVGMAFPALQVWDYMGLWRDSVGLWGIRWDYGAVGMWDYGTIWHSSGAWVFVQTYTLPGSPGSTGLGGIMEDYERYGAFWFTL